MLSGFRVSRREKIVRKHAYGKNNEGRRGLLFLDASHARSTALRKPASRFKSGVEALLVGERFLGERLCPLFNGRDDWILPIR